MQHDDVKYGPLETGVATWYAAILAAAQALYPGAEFDWGTAGTIPVLNANGKSIPIPRDRFDEAISLEVSPEDWVKSYIGGELLNLTPAHRLKLHQDAIAELEACLAQVTSGAAELRIQIDAIKAAWGIA
jgi:hypothetical protein